MDNYKSNERYTILIVDDQPNNLKVVAGALGEEYNLSFANNGINALRQAESVKPQLILLDIMMPGMDGFEVCAKLKENPETREIPIVFLSAKGDIDDVTRGFGCGAVDYITKPFNVREVKARVITHMQLYLAKLEIEEKNRKITESDEELRTTVEHLARSNTDKDRFFSIIAHDLRSPFGNIMGLIEMLIRNVEQGRNIEEMIKPLRMLKQSSSQVFDLLENLLEWGRVQTGRMKYNPEPVVIYELVSSVTQLLLPVAEEKQIRLFQKASPGLVAPADKEMLKTILRNLISNAIKFTFPGGEVRVHAKQEDELILFSVSDSGIGMDKEIKDNLFSIEASNGRRGTQNEPSSGLGLIIAKEMVTRHGGTIWVESTEGQGSVFSFSIPNKSLTEIASH